MTRRVVTANMDVEITINDGDAEGAVFDVVLMLTSLEPPEGISKIEVAWWEIADEFED